MQDKWIEWAQTIQHLSEIGIEQSNDIFNVERYGQLLILSEQISKESNTIEHHEQIQLFNHHNYSMTPKVSVRGVVFQNHRILLVQERADGCWALPGGWADQGLSPSENIVKEIWEESGFKTKATRILAIYDKRLHIDYDAPYDVYELFIECEIISGSETTSTETSAVGFFAENELPPLSRTRNSEQQIREMFTYDEQSEKPVILD